MLTSSCTLQSFLLNAGLYNIYLKGSETSRFETNMDAPMYTRRIGDTVALIHVFSGIFPTRILK
jgi:hypothetical protein